MIISVHNKRNTVAEYLRNTMNRRDDFMAAPGAITGRTPVYAHQPYRKSRRGLPVYGVVMVFLRHPATV